MKNWGKNDEKIFTSCKEQNAWLTETSKTSNIYLMWHKVRGGWCWPWFSSSSLCVILSALPLDGSASFCLSSPSLASALPKVLYSQEYLDLKGRGQQEKNFLLLNLLNLSFPLSFSFSTEEQNHPRCLVGSGSCISLLDQSSDLGCVL